MCKSEVPPNSDLQSQAGGTPGGARRQRPSKGDYGPGDRPGTIPAPAPGGCRPPRRSHRAVRKPAAKLISRGSRNHASGQCRPCYASATAEGCPRGSDCNFCHHPHGEAKVLEADNFTAYKDFRRIMTSIEKAEGERWMGPGELAPDLTSSELGLLARPEAELASEQPGNWPTGLPHEWPGEWQGEWPGEWPTMDLISARDPVYVYCEEALMPTCF